MRIMKFGGKSLDTLQKMQNICKNIKKIYKNDKKIIIIVSAIGKTTDELIKTASIYNNKNIPNRELSVLLSTGETQSSALFAIMLNKYKIPAKSFQAFQLNISTFGDYQNGLISSINKSEIINCLEKGIVPIISGFQGINQNKEITTLGRGGSDTTAVAIGAIFNHEVEIYSDFNGVFCGDPRVLPFKKIKYINYSSMTSMALAGAKVLDSRASKIAQNFNINIVCKQSSNFNNQGTTINNIESTFVSISSQDNLCKITLNFSFDKNKNFIAKNVLNSLKDINLYNFNINSNNICFFVDQNKKQEIIEIISKKLKILKPS